jgi:hypothetical protein
MTQTELTGVLSLLEKDRELQDLLGDAQVQRPPPPPVRDGPNIYKDTKP